MDPTAYQIYAIMLLRELRGQTGLVSNSTLAKSLGVGKENVHRVMHSLQSAGLVVSFPGPAGGYRLASKAHHVTLLEVAAALPREPQGGQGGKGFEEVLKKTKAAIGSGLDRVRVDDL